MKKYLSLMIFGVLIGCAQSTSVLLDRSQPLKIVSYDGETIAISTKRRTTVSLGSKTIGMANGKSFQLLAIAENKSAPAFEFDTSSISVSIDGAEAKVYTYGELKKAEEKSRNIQEYPACSNCPGWRCRIL